MTRTEIEDVYKIAEMIIKSICHYYSKIGCSHCPVDLCDKAIYYIIKEDKEETQNERN